jgi:signal transduction histidine kinase
LLIEGEALGVVFALDRKVRNYQPDELEFLRALAARAALAIAKVKLYNQLQQVNRQLEDRVKLRTAELSAANEQLLHEIHGHEQAEQAVHALSGRLLQLQDEERRRIARELHDITAQNVSAITLNLVRLGQLLPNGDERPRKILAESLALGEESLREIRTLSYLLHPPMLDELGLTKALEWYLDGFAKRSGIQVNLTAAPGLGRLPAEVETTLFRVMQESLTNIHRHSGSSTAAVALRRDTSTVTLEIRDEGHGMAPPSSAGRDLGVGIRGMHERLRQFGGRLEIDTGAQGTTVRAVLPLGGNGA